MKVIVMGEVFSLLSLSLITLIEIHLLSGDVKNPPGCVPCPNGTGLDRPSFITDCDVATTPSRADIHYIPPEESGSGVTEQPTGIQDLIKYYNILLLLSISIKSLQLLVIVHANYAHSVLIINGFTPSDINLTKA